MAIDCFQVVTLVKFTKFIYFIIYRKRHLKKIMYLEQACWKSFIQPFQVKLFFAKLQLQFTIISSITIVKSFIQTFSGQTFHPNETTIYNFKLSYNYNHNLMLLINFQVKLSASSLNTNDCFVLVSPRETYVWLGKGSTGDEKEMAKRIATHTDKDPTVVYESEKII
jgi:hypothetical protein